MTMVIPLMRFIHADYWLTMVVGSNCCLRFCGDDSATVDPISYQKQRIIKDYHPLQVPLQVDEKQEK